MHLVVYCVRHTHLLLYVRSRNLLERNFVLSSIVIMPKVPSNDELIEAWLRQERQKERARAYYQEHKEDIKQRLKTYYYNHTEENKSYSAEYYRRNKVRMNAYAKRYREMHKGHFECFDCDYETPDKYVFRQHLSCAKHLRNTLPVGL